MALRIASSIMNCAGKAMLAGTVFAFLPWSGGSAAAQYIGGMTALQQAGPKHIYSETADPNADIAAALKQARREHKRVILDFGGDWCPDCQVLDIYLHQQPNLKLLDEHFVLVHVWIGRMDAHVDVAKRYGIPLDKGVPALAVLSPSGTVLYAQKSGEFESMHQMTPASVTEFLEKWKS
jgi:thiol:disulfide interchange protein